MTNSKFSIIFLFSSHAVFFSSVKLIVILNDVDIGKIVIFLSKFVVNVKK